jgi:DNA polymerase-3 subunit delta'
VGFKDFFGNTRILEVIRTLLKEDRLPHSLLFAGPQGTGKATLAHFISKAINCLNGQWDFCDHCSSCQKINQSLHADVKIYRPDGQFIKIDQIRELSREVYFKPFEGKQRVFILDQADKMNPQSANSVLKTLEEPPLTSLLILISDKPTDILATIRSRCQKYEFTPLPYSDIERLLVKKTHFPEEDRHLLSRLSRGSFGRAMGIDLSEYKNGRMEMLALLEACAQDFLYAKASKLSTALVREKDQFESKMEILYILLHDLFLMKVDVDSESITNVDLRNELSHLCSTLSFQQLVEGVETLDHIEKGAKRNLNKGLAMDQFIFRLSGMLIKRD